MNIFCFATDRLSILQAFIVFSFHAILGWTIPAKYYYLDVNIILACSDNALSTTFKYNEWICFYIHFYSECYWILNKNVKIYQNEIWILILIILIFVIKFCKKKVRIYHCCDFTVYLLSHLILSLLMNFFIIKSHC